MAFNGSSTFNKVTLGETSGVGPSINNIGGGMVLGWTGTDSAHKLNTLHSSNGMTFFGKVTLGETSVFGPTVASVGSAPIMAWTGRDNAQSLNVVAI